MSSSASTPAPTAAPPAAPRVVVLGLIGAFYLLPPVYGALGRLYAPELALTGDADAAVLLLPERMIGGLGGDLLGALRRGRRLRRVPVHRVRTDHGRRRRAHPGRPALARRTALPARRPSSPWRCRSPLSVLVDGVPVADAVGLAFAVSASSFCPLLVLGIWWRRLTPPGRRRRAARRRRLRAPRRRWPPRAGLPPAGLAARPARLARRLVGAARLPHHGAGVPGHPAAAYPPGTAAILTRFHLPEDLVGRPQRRRQRNDDRDRAWPSLAARWPLLLLAAGFCARPADRTARPQTPTGDLGTPVEHATFETLHTASLAAPPLRAGLTEETARKVGPAAALPARHRRALPHRPRAGARLGRARRDHHGTESWSALAGPAGDRPRRGLPHRPATTSDCPLRWAVVAPLTVDDRVLGALVAYAPRESAVLVRAAGEVARWVSRPTGTGRARPSRTRLIEAEIKALRAQISPHFIFNSLAAIASFVRTDPERARELLLEFADFTRYSFRRHGDFTTLADELHSIDQYLALVRARFGDRLSVTLQIAPEVLPVDAALPVPAAARRERRQTRPGGRQDRQCRISITRAGRGAEADGGHRGRRRRHGPGRAAPDPRGESGPAPPASACPTSTSGCARCTATTTASSSRRASARA